MIAELGSMGRTLLMAAGGGRQKTKTKKRAAEDTLGDQYTEKRVKKSCWERFDDEELEAIQESGRVKSIQHQRLMAASNRVLKDAEDFLQYHRTKEEQSSSCWSRISWRALLAAINLLLILHVFSRDRSGRRTRRFFYSEAGSANKVKKTAIKLS
jgi:hypothetical protein